MTDLPKDTEHEGQLYGNGAFTLLTHGAWYKTGRGTLRAPKGLGRTKTPSRYNAAYLNMRDHILETIHPGTDLAILGKANAGRAAHYLLDIAPLHDDLFEEHENKGITFVDPQKIVDILPKRTSQQAAASVIVAYTKAVAPPHNP